MRSLNLLILTALMFASISSATYHEVTLQPGPDAGKDSYIPNYDPDENFGDVPFLLILYDESESPTHDCWAIIQFNLNPYMGASVDYATLRLYCFATDGPAFDAEVFRVAGTWDEHTITFNNRPAHNLDLISEMTVTAGDWIEVDVANIVDSWLSGSFDNNGFYIWVKENPERCLADFHGSDYSGNPDRRPILEMGYTYTDVTSSSYGSIKAAFR
jgi:hypothetical protein